MVVGDKYIYIRDRMVVFKSETITVGDAVVCMNHDQGLIKPGSLAVGNQVVIINTSSGKIALRGRLCPDFWHSLMMYVHNTDLTVYATDPDPTRVQVTEISDKKIRVIFEDAKLTIWDDAILEVEWLSDSETQITLVSRQTAYTHSYYYNNNVLLWGSVATNGALGWTKIESTHCGA